MSFQQFKISRRRLLTSVVAAPFCTGSKTLARDLGYVDAHVHLWSPDRVRYPLRPEAQEQDVVPKGFTAGDFFSRARLEGVTRAVVVGHAIHFGSDATFLVDLLKARPGEIAVQAYLDHAAPDVISRMSDLRAKGVKGIRLFLLDTPPDLAPGHPIHSIYEFAAAHRLVICPLVNPSWLPQLTRLSMTHPATMIVVDHLARIGIEGFGKEPPVAGTLRPSDVEELVALARCPNAHVKISAFYALGARRPPYDDMLPLIRRLVRAFGPERLMWGSDSPYQGMATGQTYRDSIAVVRDRLDGVSEEDREWILRRTAERVFFS